MMHGKRCGSIVLQSVLLNWQSLPPSDKSFFQNFKQSHLQIAAWRCSLNADPATVGIWERMVRLSSLFLSLALDICLVPEEIMKVFRCGCTSEDLCKSRNCCCKKSRLPCSTFCKREAATWIWLMQRFVIKNMKRKLWAKGNLINSLPMRYNL